MTKRSTTGTSSSRRGPKGGTMTKVDGETASVAPEGTTVEVQTLDQMAEQVEQDRVNDTPDEPEGSDPTQQEADSAPHDDPAPADLPHEPETVEQPDELAEAIAAEDRIPDETDGDTAQVDPVAMLETPLPESVQDEQTGEAPVVEQAADGVTETQPEPVAATDPFADLPLTKVEDYEFRDLSDAVGNDPFKYEAVHNAAVGVRLPHKVGWKHAAAMITMGRSKREFRPGSVYGTIEQIVSQFGRAGVPAYVLVAKVRQAQIGNKRSKYCTALPPIGWADGWVDTFLSKNYGKVMEKKAPALTTEVAAEIKQGDEKAEREAARIAA